MLAGTRSASSEELSAWIGVYPVDPASPSGRDLLARCNVVANADQCVYNVRLFEIEKARADEWLCEGDLKNVSDHVVVGDESLLEKLSALGIPLESLENPHLTDYPL
jgi:hypothetical protein